jgi:hypothetical protein
MLGTRLALPEACRSCEVLLESCRVVQRCWWRWHPALRMHDVCVQVRWASCPHSPTAHIPVRCTAYIVHTNPRMLALEGDSKLARSRASRDCDALARRSRGVGSLVRLDASHRATLASQRATMAKSGLEKLGSRLRGNDGRRCIATSELLNTLQATRIRGFVRMSYARKGQDARLGECGHGCPPNRRA